MAWPSVTLKKAETNKPGEEFARERMMEWIGLNRRDEVRDEGGFKKHSSSADGGDQWAELSEMEIRKMWELDSIGISQETEKASDEFLNDFNKTITFQNGRYCVSLPWKHEQAKDNLMNNRHQAEKRLENLEKRFSKDMHLKSRYDAVFEDFERGGIIKEVPPEEISPGHPVYYLPHRPVVREDSLTTKVRPVFDASCRGVNGISLNDCVETGPNLIPDLIEILIRFRRYRFALTADITKAFCRLTSTELIKMFIGSCGMLMTRSEP